MLSKNEVTVITNLFQIGRFDEAVRKSLKLIKKNPNESFLYNFLGSCYNQQGKYIKAKNNFIKATKCNPRNVSAWNNLGLVNKNLSNFQDSEFALQKALKFEPNYLSALINMGNLNSQLIRHDQAIKFYKQAISVKPDYYIAYYSLAKAYQEIGEAPDAIENANKCLELNPQFTIADKLISTITDYKKNDKHLHDMKKKIKDNKLTLLQKKNIHFSLGKAYEDILDYENSVNHLKKANLIVKQQTKYKINQDINLFIKIKKTFFNINKAKIKKNDTEKKLIFIVGMPRSGTTLAEKIISSHKDVNTAGELMYLTSMINELLNRSNYEPNLEDFEDIRHQYFLKIEQYKFSENFFIDKAPLNFKWLGFINLIFPESKIIHCLRNKKDNLISLYKNSFEPGSLDWTNDEEDILQFFNLYKDLMEFWNTNTTNHIYNLSYENLVNTPKEEIYKILDYCKLNWDEDCLSHTKNKSPIKTASVGQANKPIYKSSLNSHIHYYKYLDKLFSE